MASRRKLSVAKAADQWLAAHQQIAVQQPLLDEAAKVLKEHFRATGDGHYRGKVGYSATVVQILDTPAVKALLGDDLPKYQKPSTRETLTDLTGQPKAA